MEEVNPITQFCDGDPGVGRTFITCCEQNRKGTRGNSESL